MQIIADTKDAALLLVVQAKESEIGSLKASVEKLETQIRYERARADRLVDRLLERDAHVAAVAPLAEHVVKLQDENVRAKLSEIFDQMNEMGDTPPPRVASADGRVYRMAGGGEAVAVAV